MSGNKIFIDTNTAIYLLGGDSLLAELLQNKKIYLSFITQLELLAYSGLNDSDLLQIEEMLNDCVIIDINTMIKQQTITVRKKYGLKLPDSIIAATAIYLDLPLITTDKDFKRVEEINLMHYER